MNHPLGSKINTKEKVGEHIKSLSQYCTILNGKMTVVGGLDEYFYFVTILKSIKIQYQFERVATMRNFPIRNLISNKPYFKN